MEGYILALDQGTTSSRAILIDHEGSEIASAQQEFEQHYPQPGWVEHDPNEIWETQSATVVSAMCKLGILGDSISAIGVTNQRETTVVWDRSTGEPVYPAIVWQDRRTAEFCDKLKKSRQEKIFTKRTGLRLDPYFSGTKIRWILDNVKGARARAENGELAFGTIDCWLIWKLTGGKVHATDATNASRTLLYNIHTGDWDEKLLDILKVPRAMLPEVKSCSEVYGKVDGSAIAVLSGRPIAGVAGDQQAAMVGQACFSPGMAKNTYGTGCFLLMNTGEEAVTSKNNLLTTVACKLGEKTYYALEGSVFMGGAVVQWLRDEMGMIASAQECDRLAESVPDAGGLFLVPAFAGLGAPHWDPYARGSAFGMTRGTGRAHFARAALEAIAYQSADLIACMERDSKISLKELRVDGGASRSAPLLQFQADLLDVPVVRPEVVETTALGAAYLAGLAVGYWTSTEDIARHWKLDATFKPKMRKTDVTRRRKGWEKALQRSFRWEEGEGWGSGGDY